MPKRKNHIFIDGEELKECGKCKQLKTLDMFPKDNKWDGLHPYCKNCKKEKDHKTYMKNPQRKYQIVKAYMIKTGMYFKYKPYNPRYYSSEKSRLKKRARDLKRRVLKKNADLNYKIDNLVIEQIINKYNGKCAYCGQECKEHFHIDHKIPLSRGGDNNFDNLALSCPHCNLSKNDKTDIEYIGHTV